MQVSWLGYLASTGVKEMNYLIADPVSVTDAQRPHFTETVWQLPGSANCLKPPAPSARLAVTPLPALRKGHVTFGSFQNLGKANEQVLALWAQVLASVPGSRLRWQNTQLGDEATRDQVRQRLGALGIDPHRLSLHGKVSRRAYLAAYGEVDIVLDTFPYPGGTTTCEALWMGVPVVTLQGERMLSRQGPALLEAATLPQWVAPDRDAYVRTAVSLALDPAALAQLRSAQRQRVAASPVFDAPAFAADFQQALQGMAAQAH